MNTIRINGMTITGGRNITVTNGRVTVDGRDITPDAKDISIQVTGNVERLEADVAHSIAIAGDCGSVSTQSGDVDVKGSISGNVRTMSGDVESGGHIGGNVSTMSGDIKHHSRS